MEKPAASFNGSCFKGAEPNRCDGLEGVRGNREQQFILLGQNIPPKPELDCRCHADHADATLHSSRSNSQRQMELMSDVFEQISSSEVCRAGSNDSVLDAGVVTSVLACPLCKFDDVAHPGGFLDGNGRIGRLLAIALYMGKSQDSSQAARPQIVAFVRIGRTPLYDV